MDCTVEENDKKNLFIKSLNTKSNYELILTEDCFLLLEKLDSGNGKIVFWSSLFAITDLQLNKLNKITSMNFYDEETNSEYQLKLKVDNILMKYLIYLFFTHTFIQYYINKTKIYFLNISKVY